MPDWIIKRTDTFLKQFKKHKNHHDLLKELDKKLQRLRENPDFGGYLAGPLHGKKSTRLVGKSRLIFQIDEANHTVFLVAIDHRGKVYD